MSGDPYSLYVTWMPPSVPNGYILQYSVSCQESRLVVGSGGGMYLLPTAPSPTTFTSTVLGSEQNATVGGLEPFTNYGCFVSANTSIGEGNTSTTVFQTTDEFSKDSHKYVPRVWQDLCSNRGTAVQVSGNPPIIMIAAPDRLRGGKS